MAIQNYPENMFLAPFLKRAGEPNVKLVIEALADPVTTKGVIRGCWVFGLEYVSEKKTVKIKLVTASTAQIAKSLTPSGVFSRIELLGLRVVKIPWKAGEQAIYTANDWVKQ